MDLNNNLRVHAEQRVRILRKRMERVRRIDNLLRDVDWDRHGYDYNQATVAYNKARYRRIFYQVEQELLWFERVLRAFKPRI